MADGFDAAVIVGSHLGGQKDSAKLSADYKANQGD
jgi:hypothetical protein